MRGGWILAAALLIVSGLPALAQNWPKGVSDKTTTTTLSTTSGNCLAANSDRRTLAFDNISGTIDIGYCETDPTAPSVACTAVIDTPPATLLKAGALHYFVPASVGQFCFIARSGTPSFTIREGQ